MNKSKIDWTDYSWNPVTGCCHTCPYCYARKQSARFAGDVRLNLSDPRCEHYNGNKDLYILHEPFMTRNERSISYPFGFAPTFHEYRLDWPGKVKNGANIFVCSMADLFGEWVPDEWIDMVFESCNRYPQHNYMFLTKNPKKMTLSISKYQHKNNEWAWVRDNWWFGTTITNNNDVERLEEMHADAKTFVSIEPLLEPVNLGQYTSWIDWVIIGAETGNRKGKVIPERDWIERLIQQSRTAGIPVFLKESLKELMGDSFIQEFPEGLKTHPISDKLKNKLYDKCSICKQEYKKQDMYALLSREKRGAPAYKLGYACPDCFERLKKHLGSDRPCDVSEL